ncbi:putative LAGLIDADG endonuclease (mitochondrion) [Astrephomene gubernaculifera]|nr:putative LAGLIDADG endonuclease [Astrephomene gubernaculifera]
MDPRLTNQQVTKVIEDGIGCERFAHNDGGLCPPRRRAMPFKEGGLYPPRRREGILYPLFKEEPRSRRVGLREKVPFSLITLKDGWVLWTLLFFYLQVGTPEAVCPQSDFLYYSAVLGGLCPPAKECPKTASTPDTRFNEWLAGLIDGDGCLLISKAGYCSCEITVALVDEPMLVYIQNKLGGRIQLRSGVSAVRYRLHNKDGIINLIHRINGLCRNSVRVVQLQRMCEHLNIPYIQPLPLTADSCWYAGFFDAEGSVTMSMKGAALAGECSSPRQSFGVHGKKRPQLSITVSNKHEINVVMFKARFGGAVYYDRAQNGSYKWYISSINDVNGFLDYVKKAPVRSNKKQRLHLIPKYYELVQLQAFAENASLRTHNAWNRFCDKWAKYEK